MNDPYYTPPPCERWTLHEPKITQDKVLVILALLEEGHTQEEVERYSDISKMTLWKIFKNKGRFSQPIVERPTPFVKTETHTQCTKCNEVKQNSDFYRVKGKQLRHCKKCDNAKTAEWTRQRRKRLLP